MSIKGLKSSITPVVSLAVFLTTVPAFASSIAVYNGSLPSGSTEVWVDSYVPNGGATISSGFIDNQVQAFSYTSSFWMGRVFVKETNNPSYHAHYWADLAIYDTSTGTNIAKNVNLGNAASANTYIRCYLRCYADGGYATGYKIDGTIEDSSPHNTTYYALASYINGSTNMGGSNVNDTYDSCNYNSSGSHVYTNAWYKNSGGSFVRWPGTPCTCGTTPIATCGRNPSATGDLNGGSTAYLSVTN